MTPDRAAAKARFLAAAGRAGWGIAPLAGDASPRRYDRLTGPGGRTEVLMDADPAQGEDVRPFIAVNTWLAGQGISVPGIRAGAPEDGFLLLEDLGDGLFARVARDDPGAEAGLYAAAVDLLAALHRVAPPDSLPCPGGSFAVPPYDRAMLARELAIFADWYLPGPEGAEVAQTVLAALAPVEGARGVLVLRDCHAENLFWLPRRQGLARVGVIDHQGAMRGHPAYDLGSLLFDARRDLAPGLAGAMTARYLAASGAEPEGFTLALSLLAVQRNLKILGLFARLASRDGKPQYLALVPRVLGHLHQSLAHPALGDLAGLVRARVPRDGLEERRVPRAGFGETRVPRDSLEETRVPRDGPGRAG